MLPTRHQTKNKHALLYFKIRYLFVLKHAGGSREILRFTPGARPDVHPVDLGVSAVLRQSLVVRRVGFGHDGLEVGQIVALLRVVLRLPSATHIIN